MIHKVLAVTCYTGGEKLCAMTDSMLRGLKATVPKKTEICVSVVAQGAERMVQPKLFHVARTHPKNIGFAFGINEAINVALDGVDTDPDYVLVLNNDLEFTQPSWLQLLLDHAQTHKVLCPGTDRTALHAQSGPMGRAPVDVDEMSAYCWLVPFGMCRHLKREHGFWLFDEEFKPAYGEDNWTSYLLSKEFGHRVFRIIRRAFVHHLRHKTSSVVPHDRGKTSKLLADKLRGELKNKHQLRPDLIAWIKRMLQLLKC